MACIHLSRIQPPPPSSDELLFLGFNQDFSCIAAGVVNGFRIFNCDPYKETFKRAIVGGEQEPAFSKTKVILWDDNQSSPIGELAFKADVKAVKLRREKLATASEKGTLIRIFDTYTGAKLQEVRRGADRADIYSISFSPDSRFFCTSSDKGTIHIFALNNDNQSGNGLTSNDAMQLSSSNGSLSASLAKKLSTNRKSKISFFGGYFSSEWSFSWFKGPECPSICCFGQDSASVTVFTAEGSYYKLSFDTEKGGECVRRSFSRFLKSNK